MAFFQRHNKISILLTIVLLSTATGLTILHLQTKLIVVLILLPAIFVFWINSTPISKIAVLVLAITLPITLRFMGKDALTEGTLLIFLFFIWIREILKKRQISNTNSKFIFKIVSLLVLISIAGVCSKTPLGYYGPAIRNLINFISSVLIFAAIIKVADMPGTANNNKDYIEKILSILIIICSLHILLSLFLFLFPDMQNLFKIFFHRTQTQLGQHMSATGEFKRAATIFTGGEELGELLAVLFPFLLYKSFTNNKFMILIPIFFIGLFIDGTRSAALLVILELIIFFIMAKSKQNGKTKITIIIGGLFLLLISSNYIYSMLDILMSRFQDTTMNIQAEADFATVINRDFVWLAAWNTTWRTLSFFGHGPSQACALGMNNGAPNFHCLYLTVIFQYGIIGFLIFMFFFVCLFKNLISKLRQVGRKHLSYPLILASVLSLSMFLVNEIKYEFNRGDSYQQFIWIVFAVYFLVGNVIKKQKFVG